MKRLNPRRVKVHRNYTVEEVAKLFQVHKNTVRDWLKVGLPTVDGRRPTLILGRQLASFIHARRERSRQRCRAAELYCFRCRAPKRPAARTAEYLPLTAGSGNLRARCADCSTRMYRRVSLYKLAAVVGDLQVKLPQAQQRIVEGADPSVNCDLELEPDAQPGK
ncbi:MAG TPA: helix-turn-helix domain-containing protein [Hyphomicrobiaceae bacterium]